MPASEVSRIDPSYLGVTVVRQNIHYLLNSDRTEVSDTTKAERVTIAGSKILRRLNYFNFLNASPNFEIISLISSFLHVPTLSLYQAESRLAPNA